MCDQNNERAYSIIHRSKEMFSRGLVGIPIGRHNEADFVNDLQQDIDDFIDDTHDQDARLVLGGCYHSGLAYSLAYDANGETELTGETFTNLNAGIGNGAMGALTRHRQNFPSNGDTPRFIVALKPVKVILGREEDEEYKLPQTEEYVDSDTCSKCGISYDLGCFCDTCDECGYYFDDCGCHEDDCYGEDGCWCDDELDDEFISDTFSSMNAFDRARWIAAKEKV